MPKAEVEITTALVRLLLVEQQPDLADLPLDLLGTGWDNVMYRLGDELTVRLPRRTLAAPLVEFEQRWLPDLAERLPLPIPAPVRFGSPSTSLGYPWAWSVLPWFEGRPVGEDPPTGPAAEAAAVDLGRFLAALHQPAPENAPVNEGRGGPLTSRDKCVRAELAAMTPGENRDRLAARWQRCVDQPLYEGKAMWLHGDLHSYNMVQANGSITAIIDFGDITSGDPATDLAIGFSLFDGTARDTFREAADSRTRPIDDAMWTRAEGWSLGVGLMLLANSDDNPAMNAMGQRMVNC